MRRKIPEEPRWSGAVEIEIRIPGLMELAVQHGGFSMVRRNGLQLERALSAIRADRSAPVQIHTKEKLP